MATQTGSIDLRGVKQSYEGVEVGGTNLLRGTATQDASFGNLRDVATETDETLFGCTVFTTSVKWADIGFSFDIQLANTGKVKAGDTITYSIWAKTDDTVAREIWGVWVQKNGGGNYYPGERIATLTGNWTQYSKTLTVTAEMIDGSATRATNTCFECTTDCTSGKYIYWAAPKVEFGTKATTWTPAPEDVQANIDVAQSTADTAQAVANDASASAISAGESAAVATELANEANTNASNAELVANLATDIANEAKDNVSNIEQIVGSASWMTSHGRYDKSVDTEKDPSKDYYTISPTAIAEPTGSPHNGFYYELVNGAYILSGDTAVVSGKTYYTLEATLVENPLDDPSANDYYELNLNESVDDYISSHISMNSEGLFVSDGSVSKVQISSTGVSIWSDDARIASYGSVARIGREDGFNIQIGGEDNEIGFYFGTDKMAYINGNELYVQNSLSFGSSPYKTFSFYQRSNGHFTLDIV